MPYSVSVLAYPVWVSRKHSPYVPEIFLVSPFTPAQSISYSCGQKQTPQGPQPWVMSGIHAALPAASSIP